VMATVPEIPHGVAPLLSAFVSQYLSGQASPILVSSPLLPGLEIPSIFPGPPTKPQILRDVAIHNMKISMRGDTVTASGLVYAKAVLPAGIRLTLDVPRIWPDVLVFDGEVPADDPHDYIDTDVVGPGAPFELDSKDFGVKDSEDDRKKGEHVEIPKQPLPTPLPERAFARIRPDDWLPSQSVPLDAIPGEGPGASSYAVTAKVEDVPLEVLPGREHLLRSFVAKVLFDRRGALAGVQGVAAVAASIDGLPVRDDPENGGEGEQGIVELTGLPFQGSFRVGKKNM